MISTTKMSIRNIFGAFLILLLLSFFFSFVSCQCLQNQKDLLLELKNTLTYDPSLSTKLIHWNQSRDCCRWIGVNCDIRGRVIGLDLSSESISGRIHTLFEFKSLQNLNLALNSFDSVMPPEFGNFANLTYLNLSSSGFSGQIPIQFSRLTRLVVLDLSSGYASLYLENPNLRTLIQNLKGLRELYLNRVNVSASGTDWCNAVSTLRNLRVLSMPNAYLSGPFDSSLAKLKSLEIIRLDENPFYSPLPEFFADFQNLRVLTISSSDLTGFVPEKLFKIRSLQTIDLSNNRILEGSLPEFPVNSSLQNILLSYTNFSGSVPGSISRVTLLSQFDLRACNFSGSIPNSFTGLTRLVYLDLSINHFTGPVPSFNSLRNLATINLNANGLSGHIPGSLFEGLEKLNFLSLAQNSIQGEVPSSLFVLPSLKVSSLSNNKFSGHIKDLGSNSSLSLEVLELNVNNLGGTIPQFLFNLYNLSSLSLAWNNFNGAVDLTEFQKLTQLASLDLSHNNFTIHIRENLSIASLFPRLNNLNLASCKLQKIPNLRNQTSLMMLDLSENNIKGEIPNWIWDIGDGFLRFLNLSHNQFTTLQEPYRFRGLQILDLHANKLGGQVPLPPPSAAFVEFSSNNFSSALSPNIGNFLTSVLFFSLANNKISGTIPTSLCNANRIQVLDLSNNNLSGRMPSCLVPETLHVLNLRRNNLSGNIPDSFPLNCGLETLDLSWNHLQGKVPISLSRCSELKVLNLGHNNLSNTFPSFQNLRTLESLDLSFNTLGGRIPEELARLTFLSFLDVSYNHLKGRIPLGRQFQTFPESSFIGNAGLCGFPLSRNCSNTRAPQNKKKSGKHETMRSTTGIF